MSLSSPSCEPLCFPFPPHPQLGKHLTEALVAEWRAAGRLAGGRVAIVRPTLVSAVAGQPYPGYVGNLAGGYR